MGLLRSLAKRVVGRVTGAKPAAATGPAPSTGTAAPSTDPLPSEAEAFAKIEAGAQEVRERVEAGEPVTLLDVREPEETAGGVIPGARLIPLGQLESRWGELKDANEVVCYCASGKRSYRAATLLREKGLFNSTSLVGGFGAWTAAGGRVVAP